jgi:hypothetical protein
MKTGFLIRDYVGRDCVLGTLYIDGQIFSTLEPPWRDNQRNISCIPSEVYQCRFMRRSSSGKYRNVYHIQRVQGRSGILIHNGNVVDHTKGCLILGTRRGFLYGQRAVLNSRTAMNRLARILNNNDFNLMILGGQVCSTK